MKGKIDKCTVNYSSWQMQCCGDPITVGEVADLLCIKKDKYKNYAGIEIDYNEEHHLWEANCWVRGLVTRIQAVFVDKYANIAGVTRNADDSNNDVIVVDTDYIDGYEECINYDHRKACDIQSYIITLEHAVEREYKEFPECSSHGKFIKIKPSIKGKGLFWDENERPVGNTDALSIYEGDEKQFIDLTQNVGYPEIIKWQREFLKHLNTGNNDWNNDDWLDWWCRGYCLAKVIRQLLPEDVELYYGEKGQCYEVLAGNDNYWCLNTEGHSVRLCPDMNQKAEVGLFIPKIHTDRTYEQDKYRNYKFVVSRSEHHLFPDDRVMLSVYGRPAYQLGTVLQVNEEDIIIHTDKWLDVSEEYSIELIV